MLSQEEQHHQEHRLGDRQSPNKPGPSTSSTYANTRQHRNNDCCPSSSIGPYDVVTGRDKLAFHNVGNRRMRAAIAKVISDYLMADNRRAKSVIIRKVVQQIRANGGRFLKYCLKAQRYVELDLKRAHEKCSHTFRDQAAAAARSASLPSSPSSSSSFQMPQPPVWMTTHRNPCPTCSCQTKHTTSRYTRRVSCESDTSSSSADSSSDTINTGLDNSHNNEPVVGNHNNVGLLDPLPPVDEIFTFSQNQSSSSFDEPLPLLRHQEGVDDQQRPLASSSVEPTQEDSFLGHLEAICMYDQQHQQEQASINNSNLDNDKPSDEDPLSSLDAMAAANSDDDSAFLVRAFLDGTDDSNKSEQQYQDMLRDLLENEPTLDDLTSAESLF